MTKISTKVVVSFLGFKLVNPYEKTDSLDGSFVFKNYQEYYDYLAQFGIKANSFTDNNYFNLAILKEMKSGEIIVPKRLCSYVIGCRLQECSSLQHNKSLAKVKVNR